MANPYGGYPGQQQYGGPPPGAPGGYGGAPPPGYGGAPGGYGAPGYQPPAGYAGVPPQQQAYAAQHPPGGYPGQPEAAYGAPPHGIDPQVYNWFRTIDRDNSGHLNAHELQQALTNANWSHFNGETCRLMISMFDRNQSGQIDLSEFNALWNYINQWKNVFDKYDGDRSGYIEQRELHRALEEMGYKLSPDFVTLMMRRFDLERRHRLKFDSFIQACVMLKTLTDGFKSRDTQMQGVVTINYEDFMSMVLLHMPLGQ